MVMVCSLVQKYTNILPFVALKIAQKIVKITRKASSKLAKGVIGPTGLVSDLV